MIPNTIPAGKDAPRNINVIIEIPQGSLPVKYEVDKDTGAMFVDRFMPTCMHYPLNYGYIPNTLSDDGDPLDALVITPQPLVTGSVIACRPVGILDMTDESGKDLKIIAVPVSKLTKQYEHIKSPDDLSDLLRRQITHFFEHYKDLENGKWVKVDGFLNASDAEQVILDSIAAQEKAAV